ncbi:MAG: hypothetical protein JO030_00590 [Candidatus Eremiobacteraeota bacterium]|nr:hypothetical protein [Candidatus Eremiobacteraeota bacterium]
MQLEAILKPDAASAAQWRMVWQGNPLWPHVAKSWPIGWVLEDSAGEIVGCLGNIPLLYRFQGERLIAATARGWVVEPQHRGRYAIALFKEHIEQPGVDLCISTTVGPMAKACSEKFANRIPAGDWETIGYCITSYLPFAARALQKMHVPLARALAPLAGEALQLKDLTFGKKLSRAPAGFDIESADGFDPRFDAFWRELLRQNPGRLLAQRDAATLSWHFSRLSDQGRTWILTASRNGSLRAYAIFVTQSSAQELDRVRLVDYQTIEPECDLLPELLRLALRRCAEEGISVLEKAGTGIPKTRAFDEFAPYRGKQSWPFFYHANTAELADALREPAAWDPSEYDGDATLG